MEEQSDSSVFSHQMRTAAKDLEGGEEEKGNNHCMSLIVSFSLFFLNSSEKVAMCFRFFVFLTETQNPLFCSDESNLYCCGDI